MAKSFLVLRLGCCSLALLFLGCGGDQPETVPVTGKVLLDGQPLTKGTVITTPDAGKGATGAIQPDGTFELSTYGDEDGALVGTHRAAVVAREPSTATGPEAPPGKLLLPQKYTDGMTSGLTIEVTADGDNPTVLELSSK